MNSEKLQQLIEYLEKDFVDVHMKNVCMNFSGLYYSQFVDKNLCGSPACICGHYVLNVMDKEEVEEIRDKYLIEDVVYRIAQHSLGLTDEEAKKLFEPWDCLDLVYEDLEDFYSTIGYPLFSKENVLATLKHFYSSNEIVWGYGDLDNNPELD